MSDFTQRLQALSSAEDFLLFFGLDYDAHVVHVNRLHILKRFTQYLQREPQVDMDDEVATYCHYRAQLQRAYDDFTHSSGVQEKVFKVFQDADGMQRVGLEGLRASLAERRLAA